MRVLIIGGTGLISTAITRLLLEGGADVWLYNRGNTALRLPSHLSAPNLIHGNRRDRNAFEAAMSQAGQFDAVIDMIAFEPDDVTSAQRAFSGRCGQYVFTSSVDAYLKPHVSHPITEEHPTGGLTAYGKAKAACENLLLQGGAAFPFTIIRPGHSSGEGGQGLDLFGWGSHYLDRIRRGMPLIIHGDGTALWGTSYVDDVARAYVAALGTKAAIGRAYHLASSEVMTWARLYEATAEALGVAVPERIAIPSSLLASALPQLARECLENFQFNNIFDNAAARRDLGFVQTVGYVEMMSRVYGWLVDNNKLQRAEDQPYYDAILQNWAAVAGTFVDRVGPQDVAPSRLGYE